MHTLLLFLYSPGALFATSTGTGAPIAYAQQLRCRPALVIVALVFCIATFISINTSKLQVLLRAPGTAQVASLLAQCAAFPPNELAVIVSNAVHDRTRKDFAPFTLADLSNLHVCMRSAERVWSSKSDVLYIVMGGSVNIKRVLSIRTTWARNMNNVIIIGDENNASVGMITLPELFGKASYMDAQHRQLHGLAYALNLPQYSAMSWFLLVDDDSWVNVRELPSFLFGWTPDAPILFGYIFAHLAREPGLAWPSGGGGMLLSRAAAKILSDAMYTPVCPFYKVNDLTLGRCAWGTGVALVHSPLFDPEAEHFVEGLAFSVYKDAGNLRSELVIHRANPERMEEFDTLFNQ